LLLAAGNTAETERYDPRLGTWALSRSMATARDYPAAVLLADGSALVTGGYTWVCDATGEYCSPEYLASAELYVP
jgi:hypothetical protein